ncbi:DNA-protecting protein DprA [Candidatus Gottesmanbacteria bacterium]|nr:DNA-protecting protein DprA [Candidatus Gottesmanbacteria bacterium]
MDEEKKYWVAFSVFPGIGPVRFRLIRDYFGSAKKAWYAPVNTLRNIKLPEKLVVDFVNFRKKFDADRYLKQLEKLRVSVLTIDEPKYPSLLKEIPDAPFLLYIKGLHNDQPIRLDRTIGVVGTRQITRYGEDVTRRLVEGLVAYGFTIVSGMAYGVDAVAHQTAIDCGGKTIAVLGCGIDIVAPPSNAGLYAAIAEEGHGAIVSEMPLGLKPNKGLFPARNRIISGLSLGVVVTEGADDSGALITARNAGEQGREIFAVPGPITSWLSRGPFKLLKNGAKLVESVDDIVEELGMEKRQRVIPKYGTSTASSRELPKDATLEEQKILVLLNDQPMHIDDIMRATGLTASVVAATITLLEMRKSIRDYGEKEYGLQN